MNPTAEQLLAAILELPEADRFEVIEALISSQAVNAEPDSGTVATIPREIVRRPMTESKPTTIHDEHPGTNGSSKPTAFLSPWAVDSAGRLIPISDEESEARLPLELASLQAAWDVPADETESDEAWDEALRNLGVDPATGRGLKR